MPAISSNPATGFAFGVAGQYAFKGKSPESLYSSINGLGTNSPTGGALEYQFNLSGGIWGGVLFANVTSTTNPNINEKLFTYFAPGYGFGLRLMVDKKSRTNLQIDVGFGKKSGGIFFGAAETFKKSYPDFPTGRSLVHIFDFAIYLIWTQMTYKITI